MKSWIRSLCGTVMVLLFLVLSAFGADPTEKKRVALFDFEFGAVHRWWSWDWDIGKGIADMVVTNLVRDGTYSVVERKQLDRILAEQNFQVSDRVNPATAARIGKILGVNAIVIGTITQFGFETKTIGAGGFGRRLGGFGLGKIGKKKSKATVVVDARLVDTQTAEILAVASGKGMSQRGGMELLGEGSGGGGSVDMNTGNFQETIIGEATRQAVDEITRQLVAQVESVNFTIIEINGIVADVVDNILILNVGSNHGVREGDSLSIERILREVKDPSTGEVIRVLTKAIGTAQVTSADERSSIAEFSGIGQPQVGDAVKSQ